MRTLTNALKASRVHQAYLFTGSRGIGKTSIARIFAKALRCENTRVDDQGVLRSCDACSFCKEITLGTSVDVLEIDGASNNGVDAIRDIRENVKFLPSAGARKIYIIDEVHMLTTAAFNALLKTLEEPPPHVVFVFATTEPHKIPATIHSRCQRFDFKRVTPDQIAERLRHITQAEGVQAEPRALALLARAADGSMRDALSHLDQVLAFSGKAIRAEDVIESIGLVQRPLILAILKGIAERQTTAALAPLRSAYQQGHDLRTIAEALLEAVYAAILLTARAPLTEDWPEHDPETAELKTYAALRPIDEWEIMFQVLHHGLDWIARSPLPRSVLEVLIVKCAAGESLVLAAAESVPPARGVPIVPTASTATTAPVAPVMPTASTPSTAAPTWEGFLQFVATKRPLLSALLEHAGNASFTADAQLDVVFSNADAFKAQQLKTKAYDDAVHQLAREYFGKLIRILVEVRDGAPESPAAKRERESRERETAMRAKLEQHPVIQEAKALFGGELTLGGGHGR